MRIDSASRHISASPEVIFQAFATEGAMERWLPPSNMRGRMVHFDFRQGGSYRMRLTYKDASEGSGKTSEDSDEVDVHLVRIEAAKLIDQQVTFESDDPAFAGVMRMIWTFQPDNGKTLVIIRAENVPSGISAEDHEVGLNSSLDNLAAFVEAKDA